MVSSGGEVHFRGGRAGIDIESYPDLEVFFADLAAVYHAEIDALYAAGCRYIQLDDTNLAYLCDDTQRANARRRGMDPDELPRLYARIINDSIRDRPDNMVVAVHLCRGNFRSSWAAEGGYEPVAEVLFNRMPVDGYFMEWDSDRAGGFEPLRFLPAGKKVVLGLVTSKTGTLESKDAIRRRIEEATKFASLDQLCLSPQCGFASTEEGNILAEDEQWAKLRMIVEIAGEVDPSTTSAEDIGLMMTAG